MKVFVTGATGLVGSALIPKLQAAGHSVIALVRNPSAQLESAGVKTVKGTITDLEVCEKAAKDADAVCHLAFDHHQAFTGDFAGACEKDRAVIKAMCDGLVASSSQTKVFVATAGTLGLTGPTEKDEPFKSPEMPRYMSTDLAFSYISKGIRAVEIRLAPITYGPDYPHDFIKQPIAKYKEIGHIIYPEGKAWSACHVQDAAELYVAAVSKADLPNPTVFHAIAEDSVLMSDIAEVLSRKLSLPTQKVEVESLPQQLGMFGVFMSHANPATSNVTRELAEWKPKGKKLLAQLGEYDY